MHSDDDRLGQLLRAIRRRQELTQKQLAAAAHVPVRDVIHIEDGGIGDVRVERVRRVFTAAGANARLTAWWNGAAADRLLDERHARLVERADFGTDPARLAREGRSHFLRLRRARVDRHTCRPRTDAGDSGMRSQERPGFARGDEPEA